MTNSEWQRLEESLAHMTPEEKVRLLALVNLSLAKMATPTKDPLLGLVADEPDLIDEVVQGAYVARERHPLRLPSDG